MEERILEILTLTRNNALTKEQIYKKLGYTNVSYQDFEEIFEDMENKKLVYQTGKNKYIKNPFVTATIKITKKGDILAKYNDDYIKITEDQFNCLTGDIVTVRITDFNENKGTIKEVIERKGTVAEVVTKDKKTYAKIKDKLYPIELDPKVVEGSIIGVKLEKTRKAKTTVAVLDKVIGHKNEPRIEEKQILYENNFNYEWSSEIKEELKHMPSEVAEKDTVGRVDLRDKTIFTIDGDDTKDIDDAISIEINDKGNYILGVHIADVSHYVKEGSEIDKEARRRATSVYMNSTVNPMYPVELSNGICSLNPNTDRLAMTCQMEISPQGKLMDFNIFESVINSKKKMTYKNVNKILEDNQTPDDYKEYEETIKQMQVLAEILQKNREKRGYQNFDLPEEKIETDDKGVPINIGKRIQRKGEKLIESFMLAANETVATYIYSMGITAIYRDHDKPDETRLKKVINVITNYGDKLDIKGKVGSSKYIQEMLKQVAKTSRKEVYANMILRCLAKATYEAYNIGHFSVGINSDIGEAYTHFTSPIRRYPDTTIHRILKAILHNNIEMLYEDSYKQKIIEIAKHSSIQEQNADKCERESNKMKMAEYMQNFIDEEYEGIIYGFTPSGMFVQLPNLVEGRVAYDTMDDYYIYDEDGEILQGERTKQIYRLGDKVIIKVVKADPLLREIDFEIQKPKTRKR